MDVVLDVLIQAANYTPYRAEVKVAFSFAKGAYNRLKNLAGSDNNTLKKVQERISTLMEKTSGVQQGLGQETRLGEAFVKIDFYMKDFLLADEAISRDNRFLKSLTDPADGIHFHLATLQSGMIEKSKLDKNQDSWIDYICNYCQNNVGEDDLTWGFKPACENFIAMLAFQRLAILVMRKAMEALKEPNEKIEKLEVSHNDQIDQQVDMFVPKFVEHWNKSVGRVRPYKSIKTKYSQHGVSHEGKLYLAETGSCTHQETKQNWKEGTLDVSITHGKLVKANSTVDSPQCVVIPDIGDECGPHHVSVSHKGKVWHVSNKGSLLVIDTKESSTQVWRTNAMAPGPGSMVSHNGFIYLLEDSSGNLYKMDTQTDGLRENIGKGWYSTKLTAVESEPDTLYARTYGVAYHTIYKIDVSQHGQCKYKPLKGYWQGGLAITGHGHYLYTTGKDSHIWTIDTKDDTYKCITETGVEGAITRLFSHSMSIVVVHKPAFKDEQTSIIKPNWVPLPDDYMERLKPKQESD